MSKDPWFKFFPSDFVADMQECELEEVGAWALIICTLRKDDTKGTATKTLKNWAKILRNSTQKTRKILAELQSKNIADITPNLTEKGAKISAKTPVTITSRRQVREEKNKEYERDKKQRQRAGTTKCPENVPENSPDFPGDVPTDVPAMSRGHYIPYSRSQKEEEVKPTHTCTAEDVVEGPLGACEEKRKIPASELKNFERLWSLWPVQKNREKALNTYVELWRKGELPEMWVLDDRVQVFLAEDEEWERGIVPRLHNWLREKGWEDEPRRKTQSEAGNQRGAPRGSTYGQQQDLENRMVSSELDSIEERVCGRDERQGQAGPGQLE
jgi:uncharacterized protein YdaU (DUF1376 family)